MVSRGLNSCPITSHVVHVLGFRHSWCASRTCRPWDMSLGLAPSNCGVFAAVAGLWPFIFLAANSSEIPGSCARNPEPPRSNLQVCPHRLCPLKPLATSKRQPLGFGDWPIFVPWPSAAARVRRDFIPIGGLLYGWTWPYLKIFWCLGLEFWTMPVICACMSEKYSPEATIYMVSACFRHFVLQQPPKR